MKIAVINFSGNLGRTTIARHLLLPRIVGAELFSVESLNSADGECHAMRGRQFGELQELLQTIDHAVVDIGACNVEELPEVPRQPRGLRCLCGSYRAGPQAAAGHHRHAGRAGAAAVVDTQGDDAHQG